MGPRGEALPLLIAELRRYDDDRLEGTFNILEMRALMMRLGYTTGDDIAAVFALAGIRKRIGWNVYFAWHEKVHWQY